MYKKVSTDLNTIQRETDTLKFWNDQKIFNKSVEQSAGRPAFAFYDGPPTANGRPHVGHVLTRAIKDLIPRYKTMKGFNVLRKAGWDTHGLPVETGVEKELGIQGKQQIEGYGIEEFIQKCKASVWEYKELWETFSEKSAFWVDMNDPYVTYDNNYIESVWWALRQIWDKGLIYKGHRVSPYCPSCGTTLSSHEVAQGYKDLTEDSVYVQFKVKEQTNTYLLAWTTTPWTLPSNVALAVNGDEDYAKVSHNGNTYILAKALVEEVIPEGTITEVVKGKALEYLAYEPLFDFVKVDKKAFYVTCDGYVTLDSGTGIVHNAPAFGEDDNRVARNYDLPFIQLVDDHGKFLDSVTLWAGEPIKQADPAIIKHLQDKGNMFKVHNITHSYPHCWRCNHYLIYYARESWFIEMTKVRDKLVANNNKVNWMPENIKQGRFGNFLENVIDWNLSRERYWGTPLPVWECDNDTCGHKHLVGSIAELREMATSDLTDLELHKPYVDNIKLACPKCQGNMTRIKEVIDAWFDSGSMPFAQFHYPFENKELFEQNFPANFISEGIDQTRGWFYTLMAISTLLFDKNPYENVIVLGHVQDKNGKKMSKSLGNVVDPMEAINTYGADAIRWYFYSVSAPWLSSRFSDTSIRESANKFMGTLWNTYAFYVLYANIDGFDPTAHTLATDLPLMDRWVLSKLNSTIAFVDQCMEEYKLTEASRALDELVDNVSNWYIRRSRERFWVSGMPQDKINAYMTLYTVLKNVVLLSAPFIPFITEDIWQNLVRSVEKTAPESVHLANYPVADTQWINPALEAQMDSVYQISGLGRTARNVANLKNRQPLAKMYVNLPAGITLDEDYKAIIKGELNIKTVEFIEDVSEYASYKFKPQLKTLGPKYGKLLGKISKFLSEAKPSLREELKQGVSFELDGTQVELTTDDVLIETMQSEGFATETNGQITIVLETDLTPELIEEGNVREVISKLQTMRKEARFEVTDKIQIRYGASDLTALMEKHSQYIMGEVVATGLSQGIETTGYTKTWDINGVSIELEVRKV